MSALDLLKSGDVDQALVELFDQVRSEPDQARHRIFLFQLLCVVGQWDRALTQLNVAQELDPSAGVMAKAYQEILQCEALRRQVFSGARTPLIFGEPRPWLAKMVEALRLEGSNQSDAAYKLRQEAFEEAPATVGRLTFAAFSNADSDMNEVRFGWLADGDTRLGPILEFVVNGRYYWSSLSHISEIAIEPPADLRDLVWTPGHFRWANGGEAVGVIPTRYVGSESHQDGAVRLARSTTWRETGENAYEGIGQRVFMTNQGEYGILDIRRITFDPDSGET